MCGKHGSLRGDQNEVTDSCTNYVSEVDNSPRNSSEAEVVTYL